MAKGGAIGAALGALGGLGGGGGQANPVGVRPGGSLMGAAFSRMHEAAPAAPAQPALTANNPAARYFNAPGIMQRPQAAPAPTPAPAPQPAPAPAPAPQPLQGNQQFLSSVPPWMANYYGGGFPASRGQMGGLLGGLLGNLNGPGMASPYGSLFGRLQGLFG